MRIKLPKPTINIIDNPPGIYGTLFTADHRFMAAKHKGKYKIKHRYYSQINKIDSKATVIIKLKNDTEEFIKKGRYTDYYYV